MTDPVARSVQVDGAETHLVERSGTASADAAAPIVLLHGNPDSADLWRPVLERLDVPQRLVAPDLPGFARSDEPAAHRERLADDPLGAMSAWVDAFLEALGGAADGPVHLVGHDFGGVYAGAWAIDHPERVASLTMIDTFFHADHRWHAWARVWRTPLLGELSMLAMSWPLFRMEMRRGSERLDDEHLRATWRLVTPRARRAVLRLYRAADPEIFAGGPEASLRRLMRARPSAAIWGAHDPYLPVAGARAFDARRVLVLDDCGHWPPVERPEVVAEAIARAVAAPLAPVDERA